MIIIFNMPVTDPPVRYLPCLHDNPELDNTRRVRKHQK